MATRIATRALPRVRVNTRQWSRYTFINGVRSISNIPHPRVAALLPNHVISIQQKRLASTTSEGELKHLPLNAFHLSHGAKMVPFAGHSMPLVYDDQTHLQSHHWTREKASLFDVGHMLQHTFSGPQAEAFLHRITPSYLPSLAPLNSVLSVLLHSTGGIIDDTIITRLDRPNTFRLVTNGATSSKVVTCIKTELSTIPPGEVTWTTSHSHDSGLLALQGPLSIKILASLLSPLDRKTLVSLYFGQSTYLSLQRVQGAPILVSRGGYTGEDGFELATSSPEQTIALAQSLYEAGNHGENLRLAGLAARDSLRLEAGMCLYGHDLDDTTTPVEAALGWVVAKERRARGGFYGDRVVLPQLARKADGGKPVSRKRVGLVVDGAPAREGAAVYTAGEQSEGKEPIGVITSGGPSPTLGKNIAMGYVSSPAYAKIGTQVGVLVRGKVRTATVTKMPFVEAKYYRADAGKTEKVPVTDGATQGAAPM